MGEDGTPAHPAAHAMLVQRSGKDLGGCVLAYPESREGGPPCRLKRGMSTFVQTC
jgi:hypothetical protein